MNRPISQLFSNATMSMQHSFIREILRMTKGVSGVISFAGGLPNPESFPKVILADIFCQVVNQEGEDVLQYGASEGDAILKTEIKKIEKIPDLPDDELVVTVGSTNAIYFFTRTLVNPGEIIISKKVFERVYQIVNVDPKTITTKHPDREPDLEAYLVKGLKDKNISR